MKIIPLKAVKEYQCPGCLNGSDPETCWSYKESSVGCSSHVPGTMGLGSGTFYLGLPKGFCRLGPTPSRGVEVYQSWAAMLELHPNLKTMFSVPVWKHLDSHGNTIIRWFSPRTNYGWSSVVLGDCRHDMPSAVEITQEHLDLMD